MKNLLRVIKYNFLALLQEPFYHIGEMQVGKYVIDRIELYFDEKTYYCYISKNFLTEGFDLSEVPMEDKIQLLIEEFRKTYDQTVELETEKLP